VGQKKPYPQTISTENCKGEEVIRELLKGEKSQKITAHDSTEEAFSRAFQGNFRDNIHLLQRWDGRRMSLFGVVLKRRERALGNWGGLSL